MHHAFFRTSLSSLFLIQTYKETLLGKFANKTAVPSTVDTKKKTPHNLSLFVAAETSNTYLKNSSRIETMRVLLIPKVNQVCICHRDKCSLLLALAILVGVFPRTVAIIGHYH